MRPAPLPPDEAARLRSVQRYETLLREAHHAGDFDDCAKLAAYVCQTPISLITLVAEDKQWFKSAVGLEIQETPRDISFCAHAILGDDVFEVPDTHDDERFRDNPLVTGEPGIRFYAGAPLVTREGHRLGTVCVIDRSPRTLTSEQREALARLAAQVAKLMELLRVTGELARERARLEATMQAAAVAPWSYDLTEGFFTATDAFYELCGTTAEREGGYQMPLGAYARDFVHPDDAPLVEDARSLLESAPAGTSSQLEHRIVRRDGEVRHVLGSYRVLRDAEGRLIGAEGAMHDITQRKAAEDLVNDLNLRLEEMVEAGSERLVEQQRLNTRVLESLAEGVVACDADGQLVLFNRTAREWYGTDPTAIPLEEWAQHYDVYEGDSVTPLVMERFPLYRALRGEQVEDAEICVTLKGADPRYLMASGGPLLDDAGKKHGAVVALHDVTERRRSDEALRAKHRQLIEAERVGGVGGFEFDLASNTLSWTDELCRIYGVDPETFSPSFEDFLSRIHPDDRGRVQGILSRAIEDVGAFDHEERIIRPDGEIRILHTRGRVLAAEDGRPPRVSGVCQDVTERVERARDMRMALATLDATLDGAFIFDPDSLRFDYVSEGAVRQLGYSRQELLTMTPVDIKPDFEEEGFREMLRSISQSESGTHQFTTRHRTKEGHDLSVEIVLQYVAPLGESPHFIAIARDVTERLAIERRVHRSQRLESIGRLVSGIAHDLNNALAPILMGVELLKMDHPGESELLESFETSARRGADMVRQLLTFAKGAEGRRSAVQPSSLLKEMRTLISGSFPKNVHLKMEEEPELPTILGDATQIHQVLLNFCVNARDAMPGGGTITLGAKVADVDSTYASAFADAKPGRYVSLWVQDTGTGIPPDVLEQIFDPFFTTKDPDKGTGLGLSTVVGIVKGHGGFLSVYSTPGEGSTFRVYLPVGEVVGGGQPERTPQREFRGVGQMILVVDDEHAIRTTARAVMEGLGFIVLTAVDGADALIQAAEHREQLAVVITDLHMPEMDGLAFVRVLRRMMPDVPVVVASGQLADDVAVAFASLGVTHRLDKPFTQADLARTLSAML